MMRSACLALLLSAVLAGCASTPQATNARDAETKQFQSYPATSGIYIYRVDRNLDSDLPVLYLDGRLIGASLPRSYFRVDVNPGWHSLNGVAADLGNFTLETRPDQVYYIELTALGSQSHYRLVPAAAAQRTLLACCSLMERWAPGQRPLLR